MRRDVFATIIDRIYSTFGRTSPVGNVLTVIWSRAQDIPDEAAVAVADRICDEDRLPGNMGKAMYAGWLDWMERNPSRITNKSGCEQCDDGWMHCWSHTHGYADNRLLYWLAPCATCRPQADGASTASALTARKVLVMPAHYPGGALFFDRDNGLGVLYVLNGAQGDLSGKRPNVTDMRRDMRRFSGLSEAEYADAVGQA